MLPRARKNTVSATPSAADIDEGATDFQHFAAQVPDRPNTTIGVVPAPDNAQTTRSSGPKKKRVYKKKTVATKATKANETETATGEPVNTKATVSTADKDKPVKSTSSPKGKGKAKATTKPRGPRKTKASPKAKIETTNTEQIYQELIDNEDAADKEAKPPPIPKKGKSKTPSKPRAPRKPKVPAKHRDKAPLKTATAGPGTSVPSEPQVVYHVFSLRLYPEKDEARSEAAALHYTQRGPLPQAAVDAFIYGAKNGKPWASRKRKNREEEEEIYKTESQKEAKRRKVSKSSKSSKAPEKRPTASVPRLQRKPSPAAPVAVAAGSFPSPISLNSPPQSPLKNAALGSRKRGAHDISEEEPDRAEQRPTIPPTTGNKRPRPSDHNLRAFLMAQDTSPALSRIPNQLQKLWWEDSSNNSSSDEDGARSVASRVSVRSVGSDNFRVQAVPLLSRIRTNIKCHGAFTSAETANRAALDVILKLASPPPNARADEKVIYQRDIVEYLHNRYLSSDMADGEEGEKLASLELEPNVVHYCWDFFSVKVWVVKAVLGEAMGSR